MMTTEALMPNTNRPYGPGANTVAVLRRLRSRNLPDRIDIEYLIDSGIPEATASRTLFALRFLNLVNERGEPTQQLRSIHVSTDEEYQSILETLVRTAYSDVFEVIDPAEEGQDRLLNFFRRYTPASQRSRMVMFFQAMLREAGISTLDTPRKRGMVGTKPSGKLVASRTSKPKPKSDAPMNQPNSGNERRSTGLHAALEGLIMSLPEPGTPLTPDQRERWLSMASATLNFIYPDFVPSFDEPSGEGNEEFDPPDDDE